MRGMRAAPDDAAPARPCADSTRGLLRPMLIYKKIKYNGDFLVARAPMDADDQPLTPSSSDNGEHDDEAAMSEDAIPDTSADAIADETLEDAKGEVPQNSDGDAESEDEADSERIGRRRPRRASSEAAMRAMAKKNPADSDSEGDGTGKDDDHRDEEAIHEASERIVDIPETDGWRVHFKCRLGGQSSGQIDRYGSGRSINPRTFRKLRVCSYWLPPASAPCKKKRFRSYVEISREKCVSAEQLAQIKSFTEIGRTELQSQLPTSKRREEARLRRDEDRLDAKRKKLEEKLAESRLKKCDPSLVVEYTCPMGWCAFRHDAHHAPLRYAARHFDRMGNVPPHDAPCVCTTSSLIATDPIRRQLTCLRAWPAYGSRLGTAPLLRVLLSAARRGRSSRSESFSSSRRSSTSAAFTGQCARARACA